MKIKEGYILDSIGGQKIAVSLEAEQDSFSGVIKLNHAGAFLWELLAQEVEEASLVEALTKKYDVSEEMAARDVEAFLSILEKNGILERK